MPIGQRAGHFFEDGKREDQSLPGSGRRSTARFEVCAVSVIKKIIDRFLEVCCIALFGVLTLLVVWQVFTRYVLKNPSSFSEQLATYLFVWLVLLGGALVFGENGHMAMDFLKDKLPVHLKIAAELLIQLLILVFAVLVLVKGGADASTLTWLQATGSLPVTMGQMYLALPISGVLIVFYCVNSMYLIISKRAPLEEIPGSVELKEID